MKKVNRVIPIVSFPCAKNNNAVKIRMIKGFEIWTPIKLQHSSQPKIKRSKKKKKNQHMLIAD